MERNEVEIWVENRGKLLRCGMRWLALIHYDDWYYYHEDAMHYILLFYTVSRGYLFPIPLPPSTFEPF